MTLVVLIMLAGGFLEAQQPPPTAAERYQEGLDLLKQKRYAEAQQAFRDAQNLKDMVKEKKYAEARQAFRDAQNTNPRQAEALAGQNQLDDAIQLLRAGRLDQAIAAYQDLLTRLGEDSKSAGEVYLGLGEAYRRKAEAERAIANLRRAVQIMPQNAQALFTLALVLEGNGKVEDAEREYRAVLAIEPENGVSLNNLAYLLSDNGGDLEEALALVRRARELRPDLDEVSDTLGWIYLKQNRVADALPFFEELVRKQPANATYRFHLGMALQEKGDKSAAREQFNAALGCNPPADLARKIRALMQ